MNYNWESFVHLLAETGTGWAKLQNSKLEHTSISPRVLNFIHRHKRVRPTRLSCFRIAMPKRGFIQSLSIQ